MVADFIVETSTVPLQLWAQMFKLYRSLCQHTCAARASDHAMLMTTASQSLTEQLCARFAGRAGLEQTGEQRYAGQTLQYTLTATNKPRKSSYAPKASRSGGCQGGNGRVIFATT
jgi:hypothetical protein